MPAVPQRWLLALTAASVAWSMVFFNPWRAEAVGRPSQIARIAWHHAPGFDNPLPEIFVERNSGRESTALPIAEPGCAKVLLAGRSDESAGLWPVPCRPAPVPAVCRREGVLCYANLTKGGYRFVEVPARQYQAFSVRNETWPATVEPIGRGVLSGRGWRQARMARAGRDGSFLRAVHGARRAHVMQGADRLFLYVVQPRAGAVVDVRVPVAMTGRVVDLRTGRELGRVSLAARPDIQGVPLPASTDLVAVVLTGVGP